MSLIDSNTFAPGTPGGGNVGISIDLWTRLSARRGPSTCADEVRCERSQEMMVREVLKVWRRLTDPRASFRIDVLSHPPQHRGLGSSSSLQMATFMGLNALSDTPIPEAEIIAMHAYNYIESDGIGTYPGFTTGLSATLACRPGVAAIDTDLRVMARAAPRDWKVLIAAPEKEKETSPMDEALILQGRARAADRAVHDQKCKLITNEVVPAINDTDLGRLGKAVYMLQTIGSKRAEIDAQGYGITNTLGVLRHAGAECAFMSSLGPFLVVIQTKELSTTSRLLNEEGYRVVHEGNVVSGRGQVDA